MPRIRTLKPEHKQHRKVGRLDDRTYRLWVGLITEADDGGRLVGDVEQLHVLIFGYQPETHGALIEDSLRILDNAGLIHRYQVDGVDYIVLPDFTIHQKINRPTPSKLPPPPKDSLNTHGALTEHSPRILSDQGSRNGSEGRGVRGEGTGDGSPAPPLSQSGLDTPETGPDGWPLDFNERKQAMLNTLKQKLTSAD